jgi:hypothetical protein
MKNVLDDVQLVEGTSMSVTVGPLPCQFANQNLAMNLPTHWHQAHVFLEYAVDKEHGYPSFERTNDALRAELQRVTNAPFRNATNEVVAARLFAHFGAFTDESWEKYGGDYHLSGLILDVYGVHDQIGHDEGATRYTIREAS